MERQRQLMNVPKLEAISGNGTTDALDPDVPDLLVVLGVGFLHVWERHVCLKNYSFPKNCATDFPTLLS